MRGLRAGRHRELPFLALSAACLMTLGGCGLLTSGNSLLGLIPPSTNALLEAEPARLSGDVRAARMVGWANVLQDLRGLGLNAGSMSRLAITELDKFGVGHGGFVVGEVDALSAALDPGLLRGAAPAFSEQGVDFFPAMKPGWFWAGLDGEWVAACDEIGCKLAAATLAGREASLFASPPDPQLRVLFDRLSDDESFRMLWIPTGQSRNKMEAASVWTGFAASAYFRNAVPADLMARIGIFRGMSLEGHGSAGEIRQTMRIAMTSEESARFIAGSYGLLQGLADGMEGIAKSFGVQPPPMPNKPQIEVTSEEYLVLVKMATKS